MLDSGELTCCLCSENVFTLSNPPRIMPTCQMHNSCTQCLKSQLKLNVSTVKCKICGNQEQIQDDDIETFPKNIVLIKKLTKAQNTQKRQSSVTIANLQNFPTSSAKEKVQNSPSLLVKVDEIQQKMIAPQIPQLRLNSTKDICQTHNKVMEIVCLTDYLKLCPMCAVFGDHKGHNLQTIDEANNYIQQSVLEMRAIRQRKDIIDKKINNRQFKAVISQNLEKSKACLKTQIANKFFSLKEAIKLAEKNAYAQLSQNFKTAREKINSLVKEESQFQVFYKEWLAQSLQCIEQLNEAELDFSVKIKQVYEGPFKTLKQGSFYTSQIQAYIDEKKTVLETIPSNIKVESSEETVKDIYSYLKVEFSTDFIKNQESILLSRVEEAPRMQGKESFPMQKESVEKKANNIAIRSSVVPLPEKKLWKVQFSNPQNFLSPRHKEPSREARIRSPSPAGRNSRSVPKQGNVKFITHRKSPQKKKHKPSEQKKYVEPNSESVVKDFCGDLHLQTLDLCSFELFDYQIIQILQYVWERKKIKCLKMSQNKLSNEGFLKILGFLKFTTNLNISSNNLTEEVLFYLMKYIESVPNLRVLNLSQNKVNLRKAKNYIDELKKGGIIVTL